MDESEDFNTTAERTAETSFKRRPRKKHLSSQILERMEFYFSDANLANDRFLSQLLQQHKHVPLDVFLSFNRIRALNCNIEDIAKALGTSQLLKVTEDGKNVYRTSAVQKKKNQDDCIIYVEQLPPDANHDWVIGIFSAYGKVEYVSIPKYKNRAAIKGFAFVEFDTPESAKKALEAFGSVGCCLPPQMPPEELCSIATYEKDDTEPNAESALAEEEGEITEKQKRKQKRNKDSPDESDENIQDTVEEAKHSRCEMEATEEPKSKMLKTDIDEHGVAVKQKKKKKRDKADNDDTHVSLEDCVSDGDAADPVRTKKSKKRKLEQEDVVISSMSSFDVEEDDDSQIKKKKKKKYLEDEGNVDDVKREQLETEVKTEETGVLTSKGKSTRKKKKRQHDDDNGDGENEKEEMEVTEESNHNSEFLKKKRKKKNEDDGESDADREPQEAEDEGTTKRAKKQTEEDDNEKSSKKKRARKRNKNKKKNAEKKENDPTSLGLRIISKNEWRRLRNKYLNLQREKMQALKKHLARAKFGSNYQSPYPSGENFRQEVKQELKPERTEYVPGVIVHIELPEPLGDVKGFKTNAKLHQGVKYVDANEGDPKVFIRCISAEVAQKLVSEQLWNNSKILKGKAESAYWEKIWQDRQTKIDKKIKVNVRGKDKLLKRAERELGKHIKFDD